MIWADGVVSVDERATLQKYVRKFEFLDENVEAISNYFIQSVKDGKTKLEILKEIGNG